MMKRRFVQGLLILALLCGAVLLAHPSAAWAMEGRGTQEAPYQISTAADLQEFAGKVNGGQTTANAVLTTDITINSNVLDKNGNLNGDGSDFTQWTPIGDNNNRYTGTFDGAGHTISGLYFNDNSADYVGLFGAIGRGGMVKDLTLADSFITGANYVGGICGYSDGSISNCSNSGSISVTGSGSVYVGGICGQNWGTITNCCNSGSVAYTGSGLGSKYVGGICGWNNGSITTSSNSGAVSGSDSYVGGICGFNSFEGSITNCSNSGKVVSNGNTSDVGGICGWNNGSITTSSNSGAVGGGSYVGGICGCNDGRIENCSNSGDVSGSGFNSKVGGICGWNNGRIENCSNSGAVSGSDSYVGGICGHNSFEGSITNCYWLSGTAGAGIGDDSVSGEAFDKTGDEYKSGKVAWLLNQWQTDGPWRQNLGEGGDSVPILDSTHKVVVQLIFNANTGNTADNRYQYANSGDTVTVPEAPTRSGYTFGGWYDNEALSGDPVTAISADATGDQTYWAKWTAETYSVKLNTNGGTINSGNVTSYTYGIGATLPTDVTRSGYTFGGWYDNEALSGDPVTAISAEVTGDQTYWAKWTAKQTPPPTIPPTVSEETIDAIADAQPGETVTVDLSSGSTKLDKEVFETLAGKDVTLVVDLGDGVSWTVNGTDIPEDADFTDLDLGVTMNSDGIPVDIINAITGERSSVQLELAHDGAFGFTMTLTAPLGAENAGYWANLYHFKVNDGEAGREGPLGDDEDAGKMTFETAAEIGDDGSVSLAFSHASQYAIVIDDHNRGIVTLPFTDVSEGDWFYDPVCFVYSQGLMTGTSATTFEPNISLSRAMLVAVLHRLEGSPAASGGDFTDVADGDWYAQAVNWAASVGVVNGFDDGTFQPNTAITREQLAAILMNYAQYKGQDVSARATLDTYNDATAISSWANDVMSWAVAEGLLTGVTNDQLQPQGNATRAQVAAILQRFLSE